VSRHANHLCSGAWTCRSNVQPGKVHPTRHLISISRVTGHFQGFETGQLLELQNGDTWQQDAVKSRYAYGYRPKASIWQEGSHHYMDIAGMYELIHVRRVQVNSISSIASARKPKAPERQSSKT